MFVALAAIPSNLVLSADVKLISVNPPFPTLYVVSVAAIVTAPVAPLTVILEPATADVTPALVSVTVPEVPPPDIPVPAVTPVISPVSVVYPYASILSAIAADVINDVLLSANDSELN